MYLDTITPAQSSVGYGQLGVAGSLGYEGKQVRVQGRAYAHSLSTHPPARLLYHLDGRYGAFRCQVALNDDAAGQVTHADFVVRADGRQVALVHVAVGEPPHELAADLAGAQTLELAVRTTQWPWCHAVWLEPRLEEAAAAAPARALVDCLGRAEIVLPQRLPQARRCIATVVSHGFEAMLDDMLGSLLANGGCQDALLLVFVLGHSPAAEQVAAKYRALTVRCQPRSQVNAASKAILYSVAHVVDAAHYLCLDADMLVLGDLRPVFAALEACPEGSILACREGNGRGLHSVGHALATAYGGRDGDLARILGSVAGEGDYALVVNDGLFAGGRSALLALDAAIRGMPGAVAWADERRDVWWRNQLVFNLALARLDCGVELDATYNVQLHVQDVALTDSGGRLRADWQGRPVRVLHFSGVGKRKYGRWKGVYGRVAEPLAGSGHGDGYAVFLETLRPWLARHGLPALAWSFYGTVDGRRGQVNDPATFPLFALLHYLLRANGCSRVLESGTARGVSAACIASAVAHRADGRVVTLDLADYPERAGLWQGLPEALARCIEPRRGDALAGMAAALAAGERYHAALLDSQHSAEHVWAEFELARQLVCPGGLILIHDAIYPHGTVGDALRRIEAAGYGVVRLWTAQEGAAEDDHLGLAVIENRLQAGRQGAPPAASSQPAPPAGAPVPQRAREPGRAARPVASARRQPPEAAPAGAQGVPRPAPAGLLPAPAPLISCIMPTRGRGDYVLQAVRYFLRQDYPACELIIVDDDTQDLTTRLPADPRIRYLRTPSGLSIGAKRNRAVKLAAGELIAQWDDDDWYGQQRLSAQAAPLLAGQADVTGLETGLFFELERWRFWRCTPALHRRLFVGDVHGGTLLFRKRLWELAGGYPDRSLAEDAALLRQMQRRGGRLLKLPNREQFIYLRHAANAWSFVCGVYLDPAGWLAAEEPPLPAEDRAFYERQVQQAPRPAAAPQAAPARPPSPAPAASGSLAADPRPLVSCIMPTADRRAFVGQAIAYFLRQDYPNRELIVVDDGVDAVADLMPEDSRIRYLRLPGRRSVGAKRNLACAAAAGEIIVHWDDDDWSAARRLSYQVEELLRQGADLCGLSAVNYYDPRQRQAWQYVYPAHAPAWVGGNTLCYRQALWRANPFADIDVGEDTRFVQVRRGQRLAVLPDASFFVATIHPNNVSPKRPRGARWRPLAVGEVEALLGEDLNFYSQLRQTARPVL